MLFCCAGSTSLENASLRYLSATDFARSSARDEILSAWLFTVDGQAHSMHGSNGSHSINNGTALRVVGYAGDLNMAYSHNAGLTPIAAASVRCDPRFRDAGNTTTGHESEPLVQKYDYVLGLGSGRKRPRRCCDMLSFECGNLAVLSAAFLLLFFAYNTLQVRLAPTSVVVCVL